MHSLTPLPRSSPWANLCRLKLPLVCLPFRFRRTIRQPKTPSLSAAVFITIQLSPSMAPFLALLAMHHNSLFLIIARSRKASAKRPARVTAPTVINSAYYTLQFWDGRAPSLEEQAKGPIANPVGNGPFTRRRSEQASGKPPISRIFSRMLGAPIRSPLIWLPSPLLRSNAPSLRAILPSIASTMVTIPRRCLLKLSAASKSSSAPRRATALCVTPSAAAIPCFTDNKFHNLGVGADTRGELNDLGRYAVTKVDADMGCFKTPSLRNLANRGRYMHDGTFPLRQRCARPLHRRRKLESSSRQGNPLARPPELRRTRRSPSVPRST